MQNSEMAAHLLTQSGSNIALNIAVQSSFKPGEYRSETQIKRMRKAGSIWESYHTAEKVNGQFLLLLWNCALIVLLIPKIIKKILQGSIHTVLVHLAEKYTTSKKNKSLWYQRISCTRTSANVFTVKKSESRAMQVRRLVFQIIQSYVQCVKSR